MDLAVFEREREALCLLWHFVTHCDCVLVQVWQPMTDNFPDICRYSGKGKDRRGSSNINNETCSVMLNENTCYNLAWQPLMQNGHPKSANWLSQFFHISLCRSFLGWARASRPRHSCALKMCTQASGQRVLSCLRVRPSLKRWLVDLNRTNGLEDTATLFTFKSGPFTNTRPPPTPELGFLSVFLRA